jgi:hypothetical protein
MRAATTKESAFLECEATSTNPMLAFGFCLFFTTETFHFIKACLEAAAHVNYRTINLYRLG